MSTIITMTMHSPAAAPGFIVQGAEGKPAGEEEAKMQIMRALICTKNQKTDDELKSIMATHPWAGAQLLHGFYQGNTLRGDMASQLTCDAIWTDGGFGYSLGNWIVESFHIPTPHYSFGPDLMPVDPKDSRWHVYRKAWWKAVSELILYDVPGYFWVHSVYYGEIEDEFDTDGTRGGNAAVAEAAWRRGILDEFNYAPEVRVALGSAVGA